MCSSPSVAKPIVGYFETEKQTTRTRQGSVLHSRGTCRDTYYTFFTFKDLTDWSYRMLKRVAVMIEIIEIKEST